MIRTIKIWKWALWQTLSCRTTRMKLNVDFTQLSSRCAVSSVSATTSQISCQVWSRWLCMTWRRRCPESGVPVRLLVPRCVCVTRASESASALSALQNSSGLRDGNGHNHRAWLNHGPLKHNDIIHMYRRPFRYVKIINTVEAILGDCTRLTYHALQCYFHNPERKRERKWLGSRTREHEN